MSCIRLLFAGALLLSVCRHAAAQMQMSAEEEEMLEEMGIKGSPMGRKNLEPMAAPIKSDLKYIYCGVCRKMVDVAYDKSQQVLEKRFAYQKRRKRETVEFDGEAEVQEFTEKMCNPLKPEGEWVARIDLAQEGEKLLLATQPDVGKCGRECRTVEAACNEVLDRADTDFTEILYKAIKDKTELEQVQRYICNRAAGVCKKKAPPLNKQREVDETFVPLTPEEKQMQDMQANLKESGMSGTMYRREDLAGMMDKLKDMMPEDMDEDVSEDIGSHDGAEDSNQVKPTMDDMGDIYDAGSGLPIVQPKEEL
mmetsp:Transcript_14524/g.19696  ORF Transcript_14524/g.19696 Transcript_14524/m.19696 type:complete len:309 (-) Transcript_14524:308-1234(-)|eukprot:scaffold203254_cov35-Tisochrysis_lutea.AAC.1